MAVDGVGGEGGGRGVREPRAGGPDDGLGRPGPLLAGQHAAQGLLGQAGLVQERVQAVATVSAGLAAANGIAESGPGGVGADRRRPIGQDPGEKVRVADWRTAVEAVGRRYCLYPDDNRAAA